MAHDKQKAWACIHWFGTQSYASLLPVCEIEKEETHRFQVQRIQFEPYQEIEIVYHSLHLNTTTLLQFFIQAFKVIFCTL